MLEAQGLEHGGLDRVAHYDGAAIGDPDIVAGQAKARVGDDKADLRRVRRRDAEDVAQAPEIAHVLERGVVGDEIFFEPRAEAFTQS